MQNALLQEKPSQEGAFRYLLDAETTLGLIGELCELQYWSCEKKLNILSFLIDEKKFQELFALEGPYREPYINWLRNWCVGLEHESHILSRVEILMSKINNQASLENEMHPSAPPGENKYNMTMSGSITTLDELLSLLDNASFPFNSSENKRAYLETLGAQIKFEISASPFQVALISNRSNFSKIGLIYLFYDNPQTQTYLKCDNGLAIQITLLNYIKQEIGLTLVDWINYTKLLLNIMLSSLSLKSQGGRFIEVMRYIRQSGEKIADIFFHQNFVFILRGYIIKDNFLINIGKYILPELSDSDQWAFIIVNGFLDCDHKLKATADLVIDARLKQVFDDSMVLPFDLLEVLSTKMTLEECSSYLWKCLPQPIVSSESFTELGRGNISDVIKICDNIALLLKDNLYQLNWMDHRIVTQYTNCITRKVLEEMSSGQQVNCMLYIQFNAWREMFYKFMAGENEPADKLFPHYIQLMEVLSLCAVYFLNRRLENTIFFNENEIGNSANGWLNYRSDQLYAFSQVGFFLASEYRFRQAAEKVLKEKIKLSQSISPTEAVSSSVFSRLSFSYSSAPIVVASTQVKQPLWFLFVEDFFSKRKSISFEDCYSQFQKECDKKENTRTILLNTVKDKLVTYGATVSDIKEYIQNMDTYTYAELLKELITCHDDVRDNYRNQKKLAAVTSLVVSKLSALSSLIFSIKDLWINNDIQKEWRLFQALDPDLAPVNRNLTNCKLMIYQPDLSVHARQPMKPSSNDC